MTKANMGKHAGAVHNPLTFSQAYERIQSLPGLAYQTTGDQTEFLAKAYVTKKGEKTIRFLLHNEYAYECCWGCETNHYGQHIGCYTAAIH